MQSNGWLGKVLEVRVRVVMVRVREAALTETGVVLAPLLQPHVLLPQGLQSHTPVQTICNHISNKFKFSAFRVSS